MKKVSRFAVLSMLLVAALVLSGAFATAAQDEENVLVIGFEQEPPNLWPLNNLTFGGLVESFTNRDLWEYDVDRNIVPVMVDEIPSAENGRVTQTDEGDTQVRVTLSEGLTWSDGTPITAADCEVWHTIRSDRTTSEAVGRGLYPDIVQSFELDPDDELTFTITYNGVFPDYLEEDTAKPECLYPGHVFGSFIEDGALLEDSEYFVGGLDFDGFKTVGYGPYAIAEWNIGNNMVMVANPNWGGEEPAFDRIIISFITDSVQMRNALEVGEIDVTFNWSDDLQPEYAAIDGVETFAIPGVYSDALWIRSGEIGVSEENGGEALMDPLVRQAIAHAVDRATHVENLVGPGITTPVSWYPEALVPEDLPFLEFNPDRARELLDEAGWVQTGDPLIGGGDGVRAKDGVELSNLRFVTTENELRNNYQLVIQEDLARVGIGVDVQIIPATRLFDSFSNGGTLTNYEWDLAIFANSADPLTPNTDQDSYTCGGIPTPENPDGFNPWQFCNERYDEVAAQIASTLPGPERDELADESVRLFHEGFFWHGLRLRATWFAVNTDVIDAGSVEDFTGSLASNWFNQVEFWEPAG
jgi:peptide/nickel transport system substrate-binding protein